MRGRVEQVQDPNLNVTLLDVTFSSAALDGILFTSLHVATACTDVLEAQIPQHFLAQQLVYLPQSLTRPFMTEIIAY
jgi:demethoxyubiquinone hydroxylase (CLK1/Coq7/Cat5 family)